MPIITVPRVLRDKLGEDGADARVEIINQADGQKVGRGSGRSIYGL